MSMAFSVASNSLILVSVILIRIQAVTIDASQQRCYRNPGKYKLCSVCEAAIPALGMTFETCCSERTAETTCRICMKNARFCAKLADMVQAGLQSFIFNIKDAAMSTTISDDSRYGADGNDVDYLELREKESKVQRSVNLLPVSIVSNSLSKPGPFSITLDLYIQRERFPTSPRSNQSEEPAPGKAREIIGGVESGQTEIQSSLSTSNKTITKSDLQLNVVSSLEAPAISQGILPQNDDQEADLDTGISSPSNQGAIKRWGALGFSSWRKLSMYKHAKNSKNLKNHIPVASVSSGRKRRSVPMLRNFHKTKVDSYDGPDLELTGVKSHQELNIDFDDPQVVVDGDEILKFLRSSDYKSHVIDRKERTNLRRFKNQLFRAKDVAEKSRGSSNKRKGRYSSEMNKTLRKRIVQQHPGYTQKLSTNLNNVRTDDDLRDEKDIIIVDTDDEDPDGYYVESGPERDVVISGALEKLREMFQTRETGAERGAVVEGGQMNKRWGSLGAGKFRRWWMGQV